MRKFLLIVPLLLFVGLGFAQEMKISGKVLEKSTGEPVIGASIIVEETRKGATTNAEGVFSIDAQPGHTLKIVFLGMETATFKLTANTNNITIQLSSLANELEQVVVTGYQQQRKKDLTGSVAIVDMKGVQQESTTNVLTGLQGRVAGVEINSNGSPGGGSTAIRIRGVSTVGNNNPLFVIDGIATDNMGPLNPNDIESMQVLKDAASASIYGSRANNGVVIITTKKGKDATPRFTFDSFVGTQQLRNSYEMLDADEWGQVYWQAQRNSGIPSPSHPQYGSGPQPVRPQFIDAAKTIPAANTNWLDEVFRPAIISSYNVGINQATGKSSLYAGFGYAKDQGIQKHTGYDRFSSRLNTSYTIKNRVTVGENIQIAHFREVQGNELHDAYLEHPLIPLYDNLGNFGGPTDGLGDKLNPLGQLYYNRNNRNNNWKIFGNAFVGVDIVKGFKFNSNLGIDYNTNNQRVLEPRYKMGRFVVAENYVTNNFGNNLNLTWSNTIDFNKVFGKHSIGALAGIETIQYSQESFFARRQGFLLDDLSYDYLNAGVGAQTNGGTGTEWALFSQFAKINYSFNGTYLLSGTIRRDGSSRFSEKNQYGVFPALSAGWRISNENFLKNSSLFDELKLRASWGQTGNQQIGDFGSRNFFKTSPQYGGYDLKGAQTGIDAGYYISSIGNENIKWEAQEQYNIGLDVTTLNNQITASADYFIKNTDGMLLNPALLAVYGGGSAPFVNAGKIRNSGIELLLTYRNAPQNKFKYSTDFVFSTYRNKVLDLGSQDYFLGNEGNRIAVGQPISAVYGYVADGLFRSQDEVNNHAVQQGKGLGRIRYKDLNNDGKVNIEDRTYIGNPNPKFNYGFNFNGSYQGFDISLFFSGVYGNDLYNWSRRLTEFAYFPFNFGKATLDAWSPQNSNSDIPAINITNPNDELRVSSYFVEKGSYLKLKSLVLGYSIAPTLLKRIGLEKARFYLQGQNLLTFTKYKGIDPEIGESSPFSLGVDYNAYPHSRSLNLGLNVSF